jgi:hypothetical protein
MNIAVRILLVALLTTGLVSCGFLPEKVSMKDPKIRPLLAAAAKIDRASLGFTPLPQSADVRLEIPPFWREAGYDAMLHIDAKTSRTIAFKKDEQGYHWIGEQEIHEGPNMYTTVDGTYHEQISITYELEHISGTPFLNRTFIDYMGDNTRFKKPWGELTLTDVAPTLQEWDAAKN